MNQQPPAWDPSDKTTSLQHYASWLNDQARTTFLKDGTHVDLWFLLDEQGQGQLVPTPPNINKDVIVSALKSAIREHGLYGVVHIAETWTYFPRGKNDHTFKQVAGGEIAVSELKPEDKTEALLVSMECRDGASRLWLSPILRSPHGVALADATVLEEPPGGRYAGLFT